MIGFSVRRDVVNKATKDQLITLHRDWKWIDKGTPNRLLKALTRGYAIAPGNWNNGYKSKFKGEFLSASYVMLDFDGGMTVTEALNNEFIAKTACFLYTSPSHMKPGKGERFRIVWCLQEPVTDWKQLDDVILSLRDETGHKDDPAINAASCLFGSQPLDDNFYSHIWNLYSNRLDAKPLIEKQELRRAQKRAEREAHGIEDGELWEFDKDTCGEDRVGLMVHCLKEQEGGFRYVPERIPGTGTFNMCWKVLAGLVHYFGVPLTYKIIEEANWYGINEGDWDIDRHIDDLVLREDIWNPGDDWCSYSTVLKFASQELKNPNHGQPNDAYSPAMPKEDFLKFKYQDSQELEFPELVTDRSDDDDDAAFYSEQLKEEVSLLHRRDNELDLKSILPANVYKALMGVSKTIPCHPDGLAALLLGVTASLLGAKHRIHVFHGYHEKFILQVCLLLDAGFRKSAQLKLIADPIWQQDMDAMKAYRNSLKGVTDKDQLAATPRPRERVQIDSTPEALVKKLSEPQNENGILRRVDELSSLFKGLTQYSTGNALEIELRYWDGQPIKQARASDNGDRVVPNPHVTTVATSQPKVITQLIETLGGLDESVNGLWGRWLFIRPPYTNSKAYRGADGVTLAKRFKDELDDLYKRLENLAGKTWVPTPEAREAFFDMNDEWTEKVQTARNSFMENVYMKAIGHTARIAGILAAIRVASDPGNLFMNSADYDAVITIEDVRSAQSLMSYFVKQSQALTAENTDRKSQSAKAKFGSQLKKLADWSKRKPSGTIITARDIMRANLKDLSTLSASTIREVFVEAAEMFPDSYKLLAERGKYRLLTT